MEPKRRRRALALWQELLDNPRFLDAEALDALFLRDELESDPDLDPEAWQQVQAIDRQLFEQAERIAGELEATGVLGSMRWWRARGDQPRKGRWWWLDQPSDQASPISSLARAVPLEAKAQAAPVLRTKDPGTQPSLRRPVARKGRRDEAA